MPRLLYIGQNPIHGTGSPVIVLRHLRRFDANGWDLDILAEYGGDYRACAGTGWNVRTICHRRWWWPPYRPQQPGLRWLRQRLLAREVANSTPRPDAILSYLAAHSDFSAQLASQVATLLDVPLHFLVHDDATAFSGARGREIQIRRMHEELLQTATACWFVSPELADCFPAVCPRRRLLYPLPEGWATPAEWRPALAENSRVYYAGHVWPEQIALLTRVAGILHELGGQLVVMTSDSPAMRTLRATTSVEWRAPFPTNREALEHLVHDASALLVSYADTVADMPWSATSFPSKLVEYCHLGLPIAVVAPQETAVGQWARRHGFPHHIAPADSASLASWFVDLRRRETWQERAALSLRLARTQFDPVQIHAMLEDGLTSVDGRRAA